MLVIHINGNAFFSSRSTYSGALYANDLNFNSPSYLYGVASGQDVAPASNSTLTYDNNVFNADFGEVCDTGANNVAAITNFKFDEAQDNDTAGEVKDSIGTFDSQEKFAQPVEGKVCRAIDLSSSGIEDYVLLDKNVLNGKREYSARCLALYIFP